MNMSMECNKNDSNHECTYASQKTLLKSVDGKSGDRSSSTNDATTVDQLEEGELLLETAVMNPAESSCSKAGSSLSNRSNAVSQRPRRSSKRRVVSTACITRQSKSQIVETKDKPMKGDKYNVELFAETAIDKTEQASCSELVGVDSPKASQSSSCYEQESLLVTPLRELLDAEDSNSDQGLFDIRKAASGSTSALDIDGDVGRNPPKEAFRTDAVGSKSGLVDGIANWNQETPSRSVIDRYMAVGSEAMRCQQRGLEQHDEKPFETPKKAKRMDARNDSSAEIIDGSNESSAINDCAAMKRTAEKSFGKSFSKQLEEEEEEDEERRKQRVDDSGTWQVEKSVTAVDFMRTPSDALGQMTKEKQRLLNMNSALQNPKSGGGGCIKRKRRQKKSSTAPYDPKPYSLRLRAKKKKKKKRIQFKNVKVYYFERSQGFTAVPTCGGVTLGMTSKHHDEKEFSLSEFERTMRNEQIARYRQRCAERAARLRMHAESLDAAARLPQNPSCFSSLASDSCSFSHSSFDQASAVTPSNSVMEFESASEQQQQQEKRMDAEVQKRGERNSATMEDVYDGDETVPYAFGDAFGATTTCDQSLRCDGSSISTDNTDNDCDGRTEEQFSDNEDEFEEEEDEDDDENDEEYLDEEEEDEYDTSFYMMQPVGGRSRRAMLKAAGVQVDRSEAPICQSIRASRQHCGCRCVNGVCLPNVCECARDGIKCQVDRPSFPCPCTSGTCSNPEGRVEFNAVRVRAHYLETMMRIQVLESNYKFDEFGHQSSPQHIRFEEATHEATSYCNPPPPPIYQQQQQQQHQQMNAVELDSRTMSSGQMSVRDTDMVGGCSSKIDLDSGEYSPPESQEADQRLRLPVTPVYDTFKQSRRMNFASSVTVMPSTPEEDENEVNSDGNNVQVDVMVSLDERKQLVGGRVDDRMNESTSTDEKLSLNAVANSGDDDMNMHNETAMLNTSLKAA